MAFHLYPQLIPHICNCNGFGPPRDITLASPWPWIAHPVSCLLPATVRPIQTRFRYGSACVWLNLATESNSLAHYPKGTRSGGFCHRPPTACKHTVSGSISLPALGFFSPFPHGTCSLSVAFEYLALEGGPPGFRQDSSCPALLGNTINEVFSHFIYGTFTLYGLAFQKIRLCERFLTSRSSNRLDQMAPRNTVAAKTGTFNAAVGLGCSHFARRYYGNLF